MTLTISEFAAICRREQVKGFLNLRNLLPSDVAAAQALRAETAFVSSAEFCALNAPRGEDFARKVREHLVANHLDWNSENLLAAAKHVLALVTKEPA